MLNKMVINRKKLSQYDRDDLIETVEALCEKVKKKNEQLTRVRGKLKHAKSRLLKMQNIVNHQRKRIVELYSGMHDTALKG